MDPLVGPVVGDEFSGRELETINWGGIWCSKNRRRTLITSLKTYQDLSDGLSSHRVAGGLRFYCRGDNSRQR
jgi:hypothetical protein